MISMIMTILVKKEVTKNAKHAVIISKVIVSYAMMDITYLFIQAIKQYVHLVL